MSRRSASGPATEYSDADEGIVEAALDRAGLADDPEATGMVVRARIEWAGVEDKGRGGVRSTHLTGLNLREASEALRRAKSAGIDSGSARPARSRTATGWHAQLRELTGSRYGRETAADRAGLSPTARTMAAWLAGDRAPSAANRERIAAAYGHLRNRSVDLAQGQYVAARHESVNALNKALQDHYGAEIRLRDIEHLELD